VCRHRSVSLNIEKICCEINEDKIAFCEKTAGLRTAWEVFGFELSVLESVSSRKNISVPRHD
jgi:hypothetical protein